MTRTVSFYSYKGGTGRTLLVANIGLLVARLGLRAVLVDLDLEAPGLPYKFPRETFRGPGVVEWMTAPERPAIRSLLQPVQLGTPFLPGGSLKLITASEKPSRRYLKAMRQIQEGPLSGSANEAAASLLELQQAVVETVAPDLLLIDSRTGITTTNAITTRVLADDIVVLSLKTDEQLDGTREVLRSLAPLKRPLDVHTPLGLYVLISRVSRPVEAPEHGSTEAEERTIRTVERFLTEPAVPLITTVTDPRISLLHNDAEVAEREELLMSRDDALSSRLLHLDYVEFGRQLIGRTLNELIDAALDSAASQDERAAWKRFFGRAEPVGEWGARARPAHRGDRRRTETRPRGHSGIQGFPCTRVARIRPSAAASREVRRGPTCTCRGNRDLRFGSHRQTRRPGQLVKSRSNGHWPRACPTDPR